MSAALHQADVIIIGGGIMGASAAFFLARRGKSVTLLERDLVGQAASGTNFGHVRRQGRPLHQLPLAHRSREIWLNLKALIGEDCEHVQSGHVRATYDAEQIGKLEDYARAAAEHGLALELMSANALRDRFPFIGPDVLMASYDPTGAHANPRLTAPAFGRAARRVGVDLRENAKVTGAIKSGEDFIVEVEGQGQFRAPILLVTAGAWAGALSEQFGEPVPLTTAGPQMAVTEPLPYRIRPTISVSGATDNEVIYCRQVERGNIVFGGFARGPASAETMRAQVLPENTLGQLGGIQRLIPAMARAHVIRVWSGVESYLPDAIPVMGPSMTTPGLFYAFGFSGSGFQIGPGVGEVMAELIATGATSTPITPYSIARFTVSR